MEKEKTVQLRGKIVVILNQTNGRAEKVEQIIDAVNEVLEGVPVVPEDDPNKETPAETPEDKEEKEE